ncbi:hypothetical protein [uncultured Butyricimonas sp.]|uniref:hypothetical protein n=1 Tax=uncultured Butyricimonas sp. TaxID=1268785 RepID=UPI0026DB834B|nr:hypothetical protein [uncultured Butyricimonas sp.]
MMLSVLFVTSNLIGGFETLKLSAMSFSPLSSSITVILIMIAPVLVGVKEMELLSSKETSPES